MIKGVNKLIIEINNTESDYFEKAILFLRENASDTENTEIQQNANRFLKNLTPTKKTKSNIPIALKLMFAAGIGAAVTGAANIFIK